MNSYVLGRRAPLIQASQSVVAKHSVSKVPLQTDESYTGKKISFFTFKGTKYEVKYWIDVLTGICSIMLKTHNNQFDQILNLVGRKRPYFTKNPNELREAKK